MDRIETKARLNELLAKDKTERSKEENQEIHALQTALHELRTQAAAVKETASVS